MASRPLWSATCPPPTSGKWKLPWMCLAAVMLALLLMAKSWYQEVISITPTPGLCAHTTRPPTPGRIRAVWARLEAGTAPQPWATGPMSSAAASLEVVEKGWMSSLLNPTTLTVASGATARRSTQGWAQQAFPFWITRSISSEAGMKARRSTKNAFRFITQTSMNGLKTTSCQKLQLVFRAASSPYPRGKHASQEPVQCPLHQSVYKGYFSLCWISLY